MKNYIESGKMLTFAAPYDLLSGGGFMVGGIFAVAAFDALSTKIVEGMTEGVFDLTKIGSQAWAVGDRVYWDNTNKRLTTVASGNHAVGFAVAVVDSAAGSTTGRAFIQRASGSRIAYGQSTTVTASDTIVTGLGALTMVVASLDSDPGDDPEFVSASIGDQAGAPAAGSFLLKTWKNTGGTDPTPLAATTFAKKVNWIAIAAA